MSPEPQLRVVVLAAGKGSRLGALGEETPKWLLDVGGRTIAERQLAAVERAELDLGAPLAGLTIVTGHAAGAIEDCLAAHHRAGAEPLHNPHYAEINNWYSVLLALREVPGHGDQRVVIVNGDLCADPDWMAQFVVQCATTDREALIAVDLARELTDESMKVSVGGREPATLAQIGKAGVERAAGEYVGMLMARGGALAAFRAALERFVGLPEHENEWYERAVGLTASAGTPWTIWETPDSRWVEIDDDADLELAAAMSGAAA